MVGDRMEQRPLLSSHSHRFVKKPRSGEDTPFDDRSLGRAEILQGDVFNSDSRIPAQFLKVRFERHFVSSADHIDFWVR